MRTTSVSLLVGVEADEAAPRLLSVDESTHVIMQLGSRDALASFAGEPEDLAAYLRQAVAVVEAHIVHTAAVVKYRSDAVKGLRGDEDEPLREGVR